MDFGVNNGLSYNKVTSLLEDNEIYDGWSLANQKDLMGLWSNVFGDISEGYNNINHYGKGFGRTNQTNDINGISNIENIENIFNVMGVNNLVGGSKYSLGWFEGDDGNLKYFHLYNSMSDIQDDKAYLVGETANFNTWRVRGSSFYSTLLVKDYQQVVNINPIKMIHNQRIMSRVEVPEPSSSSLFLMAILLAGLTLRQKA
ncbi:PEP-CTERM sorting domain-containing protein [Cognaticolwellia mytili]|uniref:PEP-CTERM sorting domain-containing protein n=1 Tax=Cognaticolwellia mytili TaxID=1888913 RepID=UPI000A1732EF|nr:PEP-CTERM sorting domain-containing protein [Cognaticolwellia mytili]